jgi:colicin import membrane protein
LALALALHIGLGVLLFWGWRSHSLKSEDDAAPAQVGLWTTADIAHAVKAPKPTIEAQPQRPSPDTPALPDERADIHLGQKKPPKKPMPTPVPTEAPRTKPTHKPTAEPTEKAKPSPAPTHKPTAKPTPNPRIEQEKQRQEQAKAKKLAEKKALEKERQDAITRAQGQSKDNNKAGGSTTSAHNGMGKSPYKPSDDYLARIGALIKRNTHFDADSIDGNPLVKIEIRLSPDGTILGKPRIIKSSGNAAWDEAAAAGVERAERLPRDPSLGTAPPIMIIDRKPKD